LCLGVVCSGGAWAGGAGEWRTSTQVNGSLIESSRADL